METDFWTKTSTIAGVVGVIIAILVPIVAWRSNVIRKKMEPNQKDVEQLEGLFQTAAYSADLLAKQEKINEEMHVQRFKDATFKLHEIATLLRERNGPNSDVGKAVTEFYESFQKKESLSVCRAKLAKLKKTI